MRRRIALALVLALATLGISTAILASPANAGRLLTVGMGIRVDGSACSLGFFAFNARQDRLAVTAGHCADRAGAEVTDTAGTHIGQVVTWLDDGGTPEHIDNDDPRGFSLIKLSDQFSIEPFFTDAEDPEVGTAIVKFGERTGRTEGQVTDLLNQADAPRFQLMEADMVILGGDSGSPWYVGDSRGNPVLAGMSSSSSFAASGSRGKAYAQTIVGLYQLIRGSGSQWTDGFTIWTE